MTGSPTAVSTETQESAEPPAAPATSCSAPLLSDSINPAEAFEQPSVCCGSGTSFCFRSGAETQNQNRRSWVRSCAVLRAENNPPDDGGGEGETRQ